MMIPFRHSNLFFFLRTWKSWVPKMRLDYKDNVTLPFKELRAAIKI